MKDAKLVAIEEPYIRMPHQIQNFVRFCECNMKAGTVKRIELEVKLNQNMHDREIRIDNGWTIKIGRGLDFYQKPGGWFEIGANDLSLRKCLETKIDIFKV